MIVIACVGVVAQCGGQQPVRGFAGCAAQLRDAGPGRGGRTVLEPPAGGVIAERPGGGRALLITERRQQDGRG